MKKVSVPASPLVLLLVRSVIHYYEIHARWKTAHENGDRYVPALAGLYLYPLSDYRFPLAVRIFPLKTAPEFFL